MNLKSLLCTGIAGLFAIAACKEGPVDTPVVPSDESIQIKVSASMYQFTKATDTAFENGDEIGLYIFNPETYLDNAKFTYNSGALTSASQHEWYEDENLEATLAAYYPYNANAYEGTFTVNADQSSHALYTASDLMLAKATSKPTKEAVVLPFKHVLSKITVSIDNQLGEDIKDVYFAGIKGQVTFDVKDAASVTATGTEGTIKACKGTDNNWSLIVAPQTASPKLAVTTVSGKQYTFILSDNVTFSSGKVSTASVILTAESIYTSFTPEISDWVADNELNFSQDDVEIEIPEEEQICRLTVKVNKAITWYDKYIYSWDAVETMLSGEWPGTKMSWDKEDGDYYVYYYDFPYSLNGTEINYIINGDGEQTNDLKVTLNGAQTTVTIEATDKKVN